MSAMPSYDRAALDSPMATVENAADSYDPEGSS